jgi:hypothetical protein
MDGEDGQGMQNKWGEKKNAHVIVLHLFQIPSNSYTGHKPQDIESVITIQYKMFQQKNVST